MLAFAVSQSTKRPVPSTTRCRRSSRISLCHSGDSIASVDSMGISVILVILMQGYKSDPSSRGFEGEDCSEFAYQSSQNRRFEPILQIVQIRKSITYEESGRRGTTIPLPQDQTAGDRPSPGPYEGICRRAGNRS